MAEERRPTSADVARAAGVSRATVSYVLNGQQLDRISPETQERVLASARELGYRPNAAAQTLRKGTSDIVLLSFPPWPLGPAIAETMSVWVEELGQLGYTTLVHLERGEDSASLELACHRLQPACLVAPGRVLSPSMVRALEAGGTTAVLAYFDDEPVGYVPTLTFDQADVGRAAVGYLADAGHRSLLVLLPAEPGELRALADRRLAGARDVAVARGIALHEVRCGGAEVGQALAPLLSGPSELTAVFAFNDEYALLALQQLTRLGLAVPGDVAVIGCDDSPLAAFSSPPLSSVRFGSAGTATLADTVRRAVKGERLPRQIPLGHPYVVRRESA
jgi:DNA-binding LacI/PurR family transcriptional regulator